MVRPNNNNKKKKLGRKSIYDLNIVSRLKNSKDKELFSSNNANKGSTNTNSTKACS